MRTKIVVFLLALAVLAPICSQAQSPSLGWGRVCRTGGAGLNVRSGPGINHTVAGYLTEEVRVPLWGEEGGWYRVCCAICSQWVSARYICREPTQPAPAQLILKPAIPQPAIGKRVYFTTAQWGRWSPDPNYSSCCDWDGWREFSAGVRGEITKGPSFERWLIVQEGAGLGCKKDWWSLCNKSKVGWFKRDQFVVQ